MAKLQGGGFNSTGVADMGFKPVPEGEYLAMIIKNEDKLSKEKTGYHVTLTFVILEGPFKGKQIRELVNYANQNPIAQEIGQQTLATIRRAALGVDGPVDDPDILSNIPIKVKVGILPAKDGYDPKNKCLGFSPAQGSVAPPASQAVPTKVPDGWEPAEQTEAQQPAVSAPASPAENTLGSPGWDNAGKGELPL